MAKFLFAFFRLQDEVEVDKNAKKNPVILTEQAWSIKDYFITWPKRELFLAGLTWEILSGHDGLILPAQVANQNTGFASSCLLADSII